MPYCFTFLVKWLGVPYHIVIPSVLDGYTFPVRWLYVHGYIVIRSRLYGHTFHVMLKYVPCYIVISGMTPSSMEIIARGISLSLGADIRFIPDI